MNKIERLELARSDKHLDGDELETLAALHPGAREHEILSSHSIREAEAHVLACDSCAQKVALYRTLLTGRSRAAQPDDAAPNNHCPAGEGVEWREVVGGRWPEFKARQLITHAALCDRCGPLLRTAVSLRGLAVQSPVQASQSPILPQTSSLRKLARWLSAKQLIPALAILLVLSVVSFLRISGAAVSGETFAAFAAETHQRHEGGKLDLEIRSDSRTALNAWFKQTLQFPVTLPAAPGGVPGVAEPKLIGARRVELQGKPAAYIAYRTESGPASLVITTDSVAVASGGSVADFQKVSFHYSMVDGYKVVTWSQHGLTYALVSQEGADSQQSCMVCHSAMHDRDLTHTPTPLHKNATSVESALRFLQ